MSSICFTIALRHHEPLHRSRSGKQSNILYKKARPLSRPCCRPRSALLRGCFFLKTSGNYDTGEVSQELFSVLRGKVLDIKILFQQRTFLIDNSPCLKEGEVVKSCVQVWQWIDIDPDESCDMLQVFSRHVR